MSSPTKRGYLYQDGFVKSSDGHCRTFDEKADGFVGGDGVGIVVLKPLQNAIKDKDNIHAIIKGSAINNDGNRRIGYTAPSVAGQTEALRMAHKISQIDPSTISFIETHGSGTDLGDLIEVETLKSTFNGSGIQKCAIGSVKTNIGHLDAAAGIAGLIKTVLSLKYGIIPPTVNFNKANPRLGLDESPFYVNKSTAEYNDVGIRRAGVNSLGMGGSNGHVVLEEPVRTTSSEEEWKQLVFSAQTESSLKRYIGRFSSFLNAKAENSLYDTEYSLKIGRHAFDYRCFILEKDSESIVSALDTPDSRRIYYNHVQTKPKLIFMFPGQGAQYLEMGKSLYRKYPVFQDAFDKCADWVRSSASLDIIPFILNNGDGDEKDIFDTDIAQPLLFSFEYALAHLLFHWGLQPDAMIGYSFGEYVAACLSGVFSLRDAINLVWLRGNLMKKAPQGRMLSVPLTEDELSEFLPESISIAVNNIDSCVVSGSNENIIEFEKTLKSKRIISFPLDLTHAGHSGLMTGIVDQFKSAFEKVCFQKVNIPFYSGTFGLPVTENEVCCAQYWCDHLCNTSRFALGIQNIAKKENVIFVEVGPGRTLTYLVNRFISKDKNQHAVNIGKQRSDNDSDVHFLLRGTGLLWLYGANVQWAKFYENVEGYRISLPSYDFDPYSLPVDKIFTPFVADKQFQMPFSDSVSEFSPQTGTTFFTNRKQFGSAKYSAPENKTEEKIYNIWKTVFSTNDIGIEDNFFELGGDSLKAVAIIGKVQNEFDVNLSIKEFFRIPTIKHLAFCTHNSRKNFSVSVTANEKQDEYPLSNTGKRMFVMDQFDKMSINYNVPGAQKITGLLDVERLKKSIEKLIERHEVLRSSYCVSGKKFSKKVKDYVEIALPVIHIEPHEVDRMIKEFVTPFNLSQAPLLRICLLKLSDV